MRPASLSLILSLSCISSITLPTCLNNLDKKLPWTSSDNSAGVRGRDLGSDLGSDSILDLGSDSIRDLGSDSSLSEIAMKLLSVMSLPKIEEASSPLILLSLKVSDKSFLFLSCCSLSLAVATACAVAVAFSTSHSLLNFSISFSNLPAVSTVSCLATNSLCLPPFNSLFIAVNSSFSLTLVANNWKHLPSDWAYSAPTASSFAFSLFIILSDSFSLLPLPLPPPTPPPPLPLPLALPLPLPPLMSVSFSFCCDKCFFNSVTVVVNSETLSLSLSINLSAFSFSCCNLVISFVCFSTTVFISW